MTTLTASGKALLDAFIKETFDSKKLPGTVVGVANVDGEIYFQGGGTLVSGDPTSGDVNPETVYWICSQTKMVAHVAALILVEQGKISFDTPVVNILPEFRDPIVLDDIAYQKTSFRPAKTVVTIQHLLNFSSGLYYPVFDEGHSGLPDYYTSKEIHASEDPYSSFISMVKRELPAIPLKFEPGTDFVYGWSSDALGFVIEKVSGLSLHNFCKQHIFDPLGMESSFYLTPDLKKRMADLSFRGKDGSLSPWANQFEIMEQDPDKVGLHMGGVGIFSTMRDYLKILRHLLQIQARQPVINPILKAETVDQIFVPALTEKGSKELSQFFGVPGLQWGTAMAIATQDWPDRRKKGSAFWGGWASTFHFIDPTTGIAVVLGTQITPYGDAELMTAFSKLEALIYAAMDRKV